MYGKKDKNTGGLDEGTPQDSLSVEEFSIDTTQTDSLLFDMTSSTSSDSVELDIDQGVVDINSLFEEFDSDIIDTTTLETSIEDVDNVYQDVLQNMQDAQSQCHYYHLHNHPKECASHDQIPIFSLQNQIKGHTSYPIILILSFFLQFHGRGFETCIKKRFLFFQGHLMQLN